jgi:hypothetical protein
MRAGLVVAALAVLSLGALIVTGVPMQRSGSVEFVSTWGYTVAVPDGWVASERQAAGTGILTLTPRAAADATITIVVGGADAAPPRNAAALADEQRRQGRAATPSGTARVAGGEAPMITFDVPVEHGRLRARQVGFRRDGRDWAITLIADPADLARREPAWRSVLASLVIRAAPE